ncbi:PQQ-dependent sugar dehydrogenase [Streptosporangium sp. NPDC004379]|uniref:PQQ-dependent sugar dehydrogenase n=1 Tax=Streptosporangium sp. NPDC004379 TaxID=3366189 RepID=UPI003690B4E3
MIRFARSALVVAVTSGAVLAAGCSAAPAERSSGPAPQSTRSTPDGQGAQSPQDSPAGEPRTLAENLAVPWGIAFLPGGDALVTERDTARLLRVTPAGKVTQAGRIDGVSPSGEGGLLGVAVSPAFSDDHQVFVYFSSARDNRIVRYRYDRELADPTVILDGIPRGGIHNGGRLAFGPDGYLYASTGETGNQSLAQDLGSMGGKILRMTKDGKPAPGNPFGNVIWSYGHRNVEGLAWDRSGRMYASEFGAGSFDEINLIKKGANYGWPEVEGTGGGSRFTDPIVTWPTSEASPSGLAYAGGSLWVGALRGQRLWRVPLNPDGTAGKPVPLFEGRYGRLRAVATARDGSLWFGTSNKDGRGSPRRGDDRLLTLKP